MDTGSWGVCMQWIVGHRLELCFIFIYIGYQSVVDSLQWNVESTSKLDFEGASTPMGPSSPHYELIYHDDTFYEGYINSRFILVHKGILVITYDCTRDNEQGLWIELID